MVAHVVLFTPRPDLPQHEREAFAAAFEHAVRTIPTVRGVRIGTRVRHGAASEDAPDAVAQFIAIIEFDRVEDVQAYLRHPAHEALGIHFHESLSAALAYDFEIGGLEDLGRLV
jgi:hypothetical protein